MQQLSGAPPNFDPIVNSQPRTQRPSQNEPSIGTPLACRRVGGLELGHLFPRLQIPDIDCPRGEVTESGVEEQPTLRLKRDEVSRFGLERVDRVSLEIEEDRPGGHVYRTSIIGSHQYQSTTWTITSPHVYSHP